MRLGKQVFREDDLLLEGLIKGGNSTLFVKTRNNFVFCFSEFFFSLLLVLDIFGSQVDSAEDHFEVVLEGEPETVLPNFQIEVTVLVFGKLLFNELIVSHYIGLSHFPNQFGQSVLANFIVDDHQA